MSTALLGGAPCFLRCSPAALPTPARPAAHHDLLRELLRLRSGQELIWASPRELLNVFQADEIGCHIITVTVDIYAS